MHAPTHACRWHKLSVTNVDFVIFPYDIPAASNVSTPLCMRVAGTNMCLNKLHVPYDIPAACNVSTPPCMRVAGINLFNKLYVPFDIPAASYVSTPPCMRVAGINLFLQIMCSL